jgi:hypothetical protein
MSHVPVYFMQTLSEIAMDKKNQVAEFEAAQTLPDNELTRRLHVIATAMYRALDGEIIDECIAGAQIMRDRYLQDLPYAGNEDFRPFIGSREGARVFAELRQYINAREKRRNKAYYIARMRLFNETGVRIEYGENGAIFTGPREGFQPKEMPLPEPLFTRPAAEPATETAPASQPAPSERPVLASRKQLKHAARRLIEAKASREAVEAFRKEGALGHWTVQAVEDRVNEMIHGMAVA